MPVSLRIANILLVALAIFSGVVLAYSMAQFDKYFGGTTRIALYYGFPLLTFASSLLCLRLPPDPRIIVAFSGLSALFALYAGEAYLMLSSQSGNPIPASLQVPSRNDVIAQLTERGATATPLLEPFRF